MPFCFLNVFKPGGITSFDVIAKLRKRLNIKKIGHSGTLDPMAQGVMQVAIGGATRLIEFLNSNKKYIADIEFGYSSLTGDIEGEITKVNKPDFTEKQLCETLKFFKGEILQTPPKFSAIKINGRKLCDISRKDPLVQIEIPKRKVQIYDIRLLDFINCNDYCCAKIEVSCSKGTYIRCLAEDIAKKLDTGAYLTALTRTKAGDFEIENSVKIEDVSLEKNAINPLDVLQLKKYELNNQELNNVKNGLAIIPNIYAGTKQNEYFMLTFDKKLVSVAVLVDNKFVVKKNFLPAGG